MAEHRLKDGSLKREGDGITARCTCGWASAGHFSSLAASAAFQDHRESCPSDYDDERSGYEPVGLAKL